MIIALVILGIILWYCVGVGGFVYWWTSEWDLTSEQLGLALFCGLMGPLSWYFGWDIHSKPKNKTYIKKRS